MQKLSKRLQAVADFVASGSIVADIGTDHGFLPIYLVERGICPQAVAMDIRIGPLERAQEHIQAAGLADRIQVRLSDGMNGLGQQEADSAVIAGMGGLAVIHILEQAGERLADFKELALEPQSDLFKVRRYLREHRMYIDREALVYEAGKFYPILHVSIQKPMEFQGMCRQEYCGVVEEIKKSLLEKLGEEARVQDLFDTYGVCMIAVRHPVLKKMLLRDKKRALGILDALQERAQMEADVKGQDEKALAAAVRKQEVVKRLEEIQGLLAVL
ncbi:MAG: class I SAM-dependent methyltransferase [Eubacterium sp.]|nr:class I SAM-dependent methyltransferase [Eubacterium sp.]